MKDNSLDGPMECEDCGKICQGIQGIRGHRRSCPGREPAALNQVDEPLEPVVEPGTPVVRGENQQITLGSRLEAAGVDVVLRTYEIVRARREHLRDSLPIRRLSDAVARANKEASFEDWFNLARDIARLELACERILQQARVSRDEPWALHQLAISIRDRWISWRRQEAYVAWKQRASQRDRDDEPTRNDLEDLQEDFGLPELENDWNRVIEGLRWLTAHTRPTL
ncbi:MAG: hypothetical protein L0H94_06810 [Nitrospira sp.]|nr:hypothetical protein [Nitrospira sp.]